MHPFIDTASLSDDELVQKLDKAYQHLSAQTRLGHTPTVESIKDVIDALELERQTRVLRAMTEKQNKSDKDGPIELGTVDEDNGEIQW